MTDEDVRDARPIQNPVRTKASPAGAGRCSVKKSERKFVVFTTLVGILTLTSALLLALAPAPLTPDATNSLFAIDAPRSLDVIFETQVPPSGHWKYIYVHHSRTASGNATTLGQSTGGLGDHFLIGNGDGAADGEIQVGQRWDRQTTALPPAGARKIDPSCITICVVGDFDRSLPTPAQMRRLTQLVTALQGRLRIPGSNVMLVTDASPGAAGTGRYFPAAVLKDSLLP